MSTWYRKRLVHSSPFSRLTPKEVEAMMSKLPRLHKNNEHFFRNLGNQGIISYRLKGTFMERRTQQQRNDTGFFCFSEYLFLLTILIKPQSGFKIAFAMLDQDGNGWIDKEEFRVSVHLHSPYPSSGMRTSLPGPGDGVQLRGQGEEAAAAAGAATAGGGRWRPRGEK